MNRMEIEKTIEISSCEIACMFADSDSESQAEFINKLGTQLRGACESEFYFEKQLGSIAEFLDPDGKDLIEIIHRAIISLRLQTGRNLAETVASEQQKCSARAFLFPPGTRPHGGAW